MIIKERQKKEKRQGFGKRLQSDLIRQITYIFEGAGSYDLYLSRKRALLSSI